MSQVITNVANSPNESILMAHTTAIVFLDSLVMELIVVMSMSALISQRFLRRQKKVEPTRAISMPNVLIHWAVSSANVSLVLKAMDLIAKT